MPAVLYLVIIALAIFARIQGFSPGFNELYKGIEEDEHEYDDVMKIKVTNLRPMSASKFAKMWDDAVVPYELSNEYSERDKRLILEAMDEFHRKTCVRFRPRRGEASHIYLEPGKGGCSSIQGKLINRVNNVWLGNGCMVKGIVMHELMHALGFIHEQNRPDRDQYVHVHFDNIKNGMEHNFKKYREGEVYTFGVPYDYGSVMHYGFYGFQKDRSKPTLTPLQHGVHIGQRQGFSPRDLLKINLLYNCTGTNPKSKNSLKNGTREEVAKNVMKLTAAIYVFETKFKL